MFKGDTHKWQVWSVWAVGKTVKLSDPELSDRSVGALKQATDIYDVHRGLSRMKIRRTVQYLRYSDISDPRQTRESVPVALIRGGIF